MGFAGSDFAPVRFSTDRYPALRRVEAWREEFGRAVTRLDLAPLSEAPFRAEVTARALPSLAIVTNTASPMRSTRTPELLANSDDDVFLLMPRKGTVIVSQLSREATLGPGDAVLLSNADVGGVTLASEAQVTSITMARKHLASLVACLEDRFVQLVPRGTQALRLLASYLLALEDCGSLPTPELAETAAAHIRDLVALSLTKTQNGEWAGGRSAVEAKHEAVFVRACRLIRLRFADPYLSAELIARELGLSTRQLQRLFAERGETVMKRVLGERVERAAELLAAPGAAHRSVTDIAFAYGFNDSSHFGRVFAAKMGATPTEWRKQAQSRLSRRGLSDRLRVEATFRGPSREY